MKDVHPHTEKADLLITTFPTIEATKMKGNLYQTQNKSVLLNILIRAQFEFMLFLYFASMLESLCH